MLVCMYIACFCFMFISSLFFYLDDSSLVGCDIVAQLNFDLIQTLHFSYYQCHRSHFTLHKLAEGVIFIEVLSSVILFFYT